jgi:multidrug efflux pump subunit AcrA (membrane-fusion protein)
MTSQNETVGVREDPFEADQRRSRRRRRLVLAVAVLALASAGVSWARWQHQQPAVAVAAGTIHDRIWARGIVQPREGVVKVRARIDAQAVQVLVREGDVVRPGQLLARLQDKVRQTERAEASAEADAARREHWMATERHQRLQRIGALGGEAEITVLEALNAREIAAARLAKASARLALLQGREPRMQRERAGDPRSSYRQRAPAERDLEPTRLVSPIAGVVLARRVDNGDTVLSEQDGPPLFEIADVDRLDVRLEIEEMDADRVKPGLRVRFMKPGGHPAVGNGVIARVAPRRERRIIGADEARVRADGWVTSVWVEWDVGAQGRLTIGQRLEAVIELPPRNVAAMVPRTAVEIREGRAVVERRTLPWPEGLPVVLGLADDQNVEIFGVPAGTNVFLDIAGKPALTRQP